MKHMKKVFCLFMAIAMTVSMLVGCGSSSGSGRKEEGRQLVLVERQFGRQSEQRNADKRHVHLAASGLHQ